MNAPFKIDRFCITITGEGNNPSPIIQATIKITADGRSAMAVAEGDTHIIALQTAMRKAVSALYRFDFASVAIPHAYFASGRVPPDCVASIDDFAGQLPGRAYGQGD